MEDGTIVNASAPHSTARVGAPFAGSQVVEGGPDVVPSAHAAVDLRGLHRTFQRRGGTEVRALDDVSLTVAVGEFVVLLGPSGCGKTTLLRCIAGLETPDRGTIDICGKRVFEGGKRAQVPTNARSLNMMFQSYALWPHMTVAQNVAFPLRTRKVAKDEVNRRVTEILELIRIADLARSHPAQLSGGQQQRVALARALVNGDRVILFDEPLSNVDAKVREQLRVELLEMQRRLKFAAIYVTHDQVEAMELADRVVVLEQGKIAQVDSPAVIYDRPANRYVAHFIGSANELRGTVERLDAEHMLVRTDIGLITCPATAEFERGDRVMVMWRPELGDVVGNEPGGGSNHGWTGRVHATMFAGGHTTIVVDVAGNLLRFISKLRELPPIESHIRVRIPEHAVFVLPDDGRSFSREPGCR